MCQLLVFYFTCGHAVGLEFYTPVDVKRCPDFYDRRINPDTAHFESMFRCSDPKVIPRTILGYCPDSDECEQTGFFNEGWVCCQCGQRAPSGGLACAECPHQACTGCHIYHNPKRGK